jgi:hypothetical protein
MGLSQISGYHVYCPVLINENSYSPLYVAIDNHVSHTNAAIAFLVRGGMCPEMRKALSLFSAQRRVVLVKGVVLYSGVSIPEETYICSRRTGECF